MRKHLLILLSVLLVLSSVSLGYADTELPALMEKSLAEGTITVQVPEGWYTNTPDQIDEDFLNVTANKKSRLKKYLNSKNIAYNLVSKDLSQEINVIVLHNTRTKLMFDLNSIDEAEITASAQAVIDQGTTTEDEITTSYSSYAVEKIGDCKYMILNGEVVREGKTQIFKQFTTMINGYGLTFSVSADAAGDPDAALALLDSVVASVHVAEVLETDHTANILQAVIPAVLLGIVILIYFIWLVRRYLKKSKNQE